MELKNPCLECDHHLAGGEKSGRRCMACQARVDYVSQIGCLGSSLESNIQLVGNGGHDMPEKLSKKTGTGESPSRLDPIHNIIEEICNKHNISVEDLRNKRRGETFAMARKEIAKTLISKPGMTHAKIAKMIGVHSSRIGQLVMEKKKNMKKKTSKKINAGIGGPPPKEDPEANIVLDFSNHRQIYDDLLAMAEAELRTPENQALYVFKLIHKKGLDALKVEEQLKFPHG